MGERRPGTTTGGSPAGLGSRDGRAAVTGRVVVRGEGLLLRVAVPGDRERMLEQAHDPVQLAQGQPAGVPVPATVGDLDERVVRGARALEELTPGDLVVADEADPDRFLGSVSWRQDVPALLRIADVGYSVHPDARGHGVAGRALRLLSRWLLLDQDGPLQERAQLEHSVENLASCRVALAAGYAREGVRRGFLPLRDPARPDGVRRHDACAHGLLPHDL